jgi:hypothetical protein
LDFFRENVFAKTFLAGKYTRKTEQKLLVSLDLLHENAKFVNIGFQKENCPRRFYLRKNLPQTKRPKNPTVM